MDVISGRRVAVTLTCAATLLARLASAQVDVVESTIVMTTIAAPIFASAYESRMPLLVTKPGSRLKVLDQTLDWYHVEYKSPGYGVSDGYILIKNVALVAVDYSRIKPVDVSVSDAAILPDRLSRPLVPDTSRLAEDSPQLPPPIDPAPTNDQFQRPPMVSRVPAGRDDLGRRGFDNHGRTWLDVDFGLAMSGADASIFTVGNVIFQEAAAYGKPPRGAEFDFGGGFMFTPMFGAGVSFAGTAHSDVVGLGLASGNRVISSGSSDSLMRTEGSVNIQGVLVPINSGRLRARVFGGPSFFTYNADMVEDVRLPTITSVTGSGWGFHVGADATYFFSRVVGLGAFARYSRAIATIDEPLSGLRQDLTLGGFQTGGGLRFRF
jgi:hypothetical protein